jgi:RimJ/RimL family protein N-acetyltransferase
MMLQGALITLQPYTLERCHELWKAYVPDPDMWEGSFAYNKEAIDQYYQSKVKDESRRYFAVCKDEKTVGEIQLKYIDFEKSCATMSIHLANDNYKNHGWGTEAEQLLVDYALEELGLVTIYADCVHRNRRSQHVLEKIGFVYSHEDETLRYFVLRNR